jgi:site-specific DNA-methyltransferase (adenine-specific)/modification methylase
MIELNKIYNESCIETMKRMEDDVVDLTITSPPYNMNLRIRNGKYCTREFADGFSTKYSEFFDGMPIEEYYEFHKSVITELLRVSKIVFYNIQIVTGSKRALFKLMGDFAEHIKDVIIWDKGFAQPAMHDGVLNSQYEFIIVFEKDTTKSISRYFDKCNFKRGTLDNVWLIKREHNKEKGEVFHGATFPKELVRKILENFSNEGDVIYDPFMGTGTTAIVANSMNRKYIGSEITKEYFELIEEKINSEKSNIISKGLF